MGTLVARDKAVRPLALRNPSPALARDLWRVAALRRALRRGLVSTVASLEDDGRRLVLASRANGSTEVGDATVDRVRRALEGRFLEELIWDHSSVADAVPLVGASLVPTLVGNHGVPGAYAFGPLLRIARAHPDVGVAVLAPLLDRSRTE
jgi:hypothetical protein